MAQSESAANQSEYQGLMDEGKEDLEPVKYKTRKERVEARRQRIKERNEARRRKEEDVFTEQEELVIDKSQVEIDQIKREMVKIQKDGLEFARNILVEVDARECSRRCDEEEAHQLRHEKIEKEAEVSEENMELIREKWSEAQVKQTANHLKDARDNQVRLFKLISKEKELIIADLRQELKTDDERNVKELTRQSRQLDLLIKRATDHNTELRKACRERMQEIKVGFHEELKFMLDKIKEEWELKKKERGDTEVKNMKESLGIRERRQRMMHKLWVKKAEKQNADEIRKDKTTQKSRVRNQEEMYQTSINEEKLNYYSTMCKKREEEHNLLKAQLKRDIMRLQDNYNKLKPTHARQKEQLEEERQAKIHSNRLLNKQHAVLMKRARDFTEQHEDRYEKLWLINEDEAKAVAHRALETERVLHEQELGLVWHRPPPPPLTQRQHASGGGMESETGVAEGVAEGEFFMAYRPEDPAPGEEPAENMGGAGEQGEESDVIYVKDLLMALEEFIPPNARCLRTDVSPQESFSIFGLKEEAEVLEYWETLGNAVPESNLTLWDVLKEALFKYNIDLKDRSHLLEETQAVQQQNHQILQVLPPSLAQVRVEQWP